MATLTVQQGTRSGTDITTLAVAAAGGGDKFTNAGLELLWATNGSGSPITLTFTPTVTTDGLAVAARTVSVLAGKTFVIGPFPPSIYNDAQGFLNVTYSGVTNLTVGAYRPATS